MKKEFQHLISQLTKSDAPNIKFIQGGISEENIFTFFEQEFKCEKNKLPSGLVELYSEFGGTLLSSPGDFPKVHLFPTYMLNSFDYIKIVISSQDMIYQFIDNRMFPMFSSGYGEHLTISLDELSKGEKNAPIYYVYSGDTDRQGYTIMYDNFSAMMDTIQNCFQKGYYFFDSNGHVKKQFKPAWTLSKKMNKKTEYWY
jgi:hypothetical protein